MSNTMFAMADRLKALREQKKQAEQRVKELNAALEEADYQLSELMAQTETQSFSRAGTLFYLTTTTRASALPERKSELFDALRREGFGDLVYETVNANSLSAFVREQQAQHEDTLPPWLSGLVNLYEKTGVGVRKA